MQNIYANVMIISQAETWTSMSGEAILASSHPKVGIYGSQDRNRIERQANGR